MMIAGALDGEALAAYVVHLLVSQLRAGDIVSWDNFPIHKLSVVALIEAAGVSLERLIAAATVSLLLGLLVPFFRRFPGELVT